MNQLEKRVAAIVNSYGKDKKDYVSDVLQYGCISGVVTELIYHYQTHEWFDTYYHEIEELREQYEHETGEPLQIQGDLKNCLAWFSFEETLRRLYD